MVYAEFHLVETSRVKEDLHLSVFLSTQDLKMANLRGESIHILTIFRILTIESCHISHPPTQLNLEHVYNTLHEQTYGDK